MDILLLLLGIVLILTGIVGCVLPILPGPPVSFLGLLVMHFSSWADFSTRFLIIMGCIAVAVTILDLLIPIWGTRKFGGTKSGARGAIAGLIIGLFFFPPFGLIIGPFVGAFVAEMIREDNFKKAWRSALGSFVGFLLGTGLKLMASLLMAFYFFRELV